jgi:hypothetical protein
MSVHRVVYDQLNQYKCNLVECVLGIEINDGGKRYNITKRLRNYVD